VSFKPYPKYKESGVEWLGRVPEHWTPRRLGYHFDERREKVSDKDYTPLSVTKNGIVPQLETAAKTDDGDNRKLVRAGDFVINSRSDRKGSAGVSEAEGSVSLICTVLSPRSSVRPSFVHHLLRSVPFQEEYYRYGKGIVADLWSTNFGEMRNILLAIPPVDEQASIAAFLDHETDKIDALIAEQQRLIELLQEKRQAVISHAVTKGLNPDAPMKDSGIEWLGEVPEHWLVRKLRTLANVVRGSSPRPAGDPSLFNGDYMPWVTVAEITKDDSKMLVETETFLTTLGSAQSRRFEPSTLLYSNSGATLGVPKILGIQACANDGVIGFLGLSEETDISFLYFFLYSLTTAIREKVKQGSGQPNLNTDIVKDFAVALPSKQEQVDIVEAIERLLVNYSALSSDANGAIALLQERRSALISAAVTGQIDVRGFTAGGSEAA
jgi:type I restriction enzyme S subunit